MQISKQEILIRQLLDEAEKLLPHVNEMRLADAEELYKTLNYAAKLSAQNIGILSDTELRVIICDYRDQVLDRIVEESDEKHTVAGKVFAPYLLRLDYLTNMGLLKDVGIAPHLIANELGTNAVLLFGAKGEEYPYLEYLPGTEILIEEVYDDLEERLEMFRKFIIENYMKADVIALHGPYPQCGWFLERYKIARPDVKAYITLDMNSYWQKFFEWDAPEYIDFFSKCNVISNSCRYIRDLIHRNPKVSFDSFWIPNGFFNASNAPVIAKPECKQNIILTVGRIGTEQKNNEELLQAFALVADMIPDWKIHLVGSIDKRIEPFLYAYFEERPELEGRVIFKGKIVDKAELYSEYANAKIFVLTSLEEGGTPNVYAEALVHGCMFITSNIDAADEITNYGELGVTYPLRNIAVLAQELLFMCQTATTEAMAEHIPKALDYANRYFDWKKNAKKIVYAMYH